MFVDLPIAELRDYRPEMAEPADFDAFWSDQLAVARACAIDAVFEPVQTPLRHAEVLDVSFAGHGGDRVRGWLLLPADRLPGAPVVVEYVGYSGGRGDPMDWLTYSCAGYPHLVMDTRGQGGGWRSADTPDPGDSGAPSTSGFMTRGIMDPPSYYFTRLFVDAARAVEAATAHPSTAGLPVVATGVSQGGGLAIAAAHLAGVVATMPDVPFLAHFERALRVTDSDPYGELVKYFSVHPERVEPALRTLSYIDVVNHARRAQVPALFSVGLIDDITPASTVFAAYNHYGVPAGTGKQVNHRHIHKHIHKHIQVYPFNGHEGGRTDQLAAKLAFLASTELLAELPALPAS